MRYVDERRDHNDTARRGGGTMRLAKAIKEKQRLYKLYVKAKKDDDRSRVEELKDLSEGKCEAKRAVYKAQEEARKKFGEMLDNEDRKGRYSEWRNR